MKSLPQGAARPWKPDVGSRWREKKSGVNVRKGEERRGKLPRAQLIGLYIDRTDAFLFSSSSHMHTNILI